MSRAGREGSPRTPGAEVAGARGQTGNRGSNGRDGRGQAEHPLLEMQRLAGNAATTTAVTDLVVQRQKTEPEPVTLGSPALSGNPRLQLAANNQPPLAKKDDGEPVALMQKALVAAGLPMPKSTKPDGMDGVWGQETYGTVRKFQQIYGITPLGGHEAGRKTLGMLDKVVEAPKPISRAEFEQVLKDRWGVDDIHEGKQPEQELEKTRQNVTVQPGAWDAVWKPFNMPGRDTLYTSILQGFEDFAAALGGIPNVKHIVFWEKDYRVTDDGRVVENAGAGASFGGDTMRIFKKVDKTFEMETSRAEPGSPSSLRQESPVDSATGIVRNITHELGHGLTGGAGADTSNRDRFAAALCWMGTELFDATPANRQIIAAGQKPPPDQQITKGNFRDLKWSEQPLTEYMMEDSGEDLAESVMAFVNRPGALKSRSPQRYTFIQTNKAILKPLLHGPTSTPAHPETSPSSTPLARGIIKASALRIRTTPSTTSPSVGQYNRDDPVAVIGQTRGEKIEQDDTWYKTHRGWISGGHVQVTGNVPLLTP
jgi:hypothetical protein